MARNILRLPALKAKIGLQRTQIKQAEKEAREGHGTFPQSFPILDGGRARGWFEHEVDRYLEARASDRAPSALPPPRPPISKRRETAPPHPASRPRRRLQRQNPVET